MSVYVGCFNVKVIIKTDFSQFATRVEISQFLCVLTFFRIIFSDPNFWSIFTYFWSLSQMRMSD